MKLTIATITLLLTGAAAFAPSTPSSIVRRNIASTTAMFSEPEEEGGLDLNLEEMFDMFDAADKGKDFEKTIQDVKKEKKD